MARDEDEVRGSSLGVGTLFARTIASHRTKAAPPPRPEGTELPHCAHCGAPRRDHAPTCRHCGVDFAAPERTMSKTYDRWKGFLDRIAERHRALGAEAATGAAQALDACGFDAAPVAEALSAIVRRMTDLEMRIADTWNEEVGRAFAAAGEPVELVALAQREGADLAFALELEREMRETRILADAARAIHARAVATQAERSCPRCGAPLVVPPVHQAIDVTCRSCASLVTFEPGRLARDAVAWGARALAQEATHATWRAMRVAERRMRDARSPIALAVLVEAERAQIVHLRAYFEARARLEPSCGDVALEVRARMQRFYDRIAAEPAWIAAGRPREVR